MKYARFLYPKAALIPIYQVSRWAQPQPFDLLILDFDRVAMLVEVRSNAWGTGKEQTKRLSQLPGLVTKWIWKFDDGQRVPLIREWTGTAWVRTEGEDVGSGETQ